MAVVAITGGTGFIGRHLTRALSERGEFVNLIARGVTGNKNKQTLAMPNVNFTQASLTDDKILFQAFSGADAVCHLSGINREQNPGDFERIHVDGTVQVVAAAQRAQVKKFVLVSFLKARPSKTSRYLDTKWKAEEIVRNSGLDYTIFKPGMVYGQGDQMITNIVAGLKRFPMVGVWPTVGFIEKTVNPLYIDDFVRLLIAALLEARMVRQTVGVFGPDYITLTRAVFRVAAAMHKPVLPVPMPVFGQYLVAGIMERTMKHPLVTTSQVRMLADGMDEPTEESDLPPTDLQPRTHFTSQSIQASFDLKG